MVSISNVSSRQAAHYYNKDNYYSKNEGQWQGKGAEALGLSGAVTKEDFDNLIHGRGPNGEQLVEGSKANGDKHRAGTDVTFSAPKSVSILNEVAGDKRVQEAHNKAVAATLDYMERHYAQARQTQGGVTERANTENIIVAKFDHGTGRVAKGQPLPDPQTHTHAVTINATQRPDGEWRALSNEEIYNNKMLEGQIYRNELAKNLKELDYAIVADNKGSFEVAGVPPELIEEFSRRSKEIDEKVKELKESGKYEGMDESKLREIATKDSRAAKKDVDMEAAKDSWKERAAEQGYTPERIQKEALEAGRAAREAEAVRAVDNPKSNEYDYVRQATKILSEQESTFTKEEVIKAAGRLSCGEQRIPDLDRAFDELKADKEIVHIRDTHDRQGGKKEHYSTPEMQKIERDNIQYAKDGQGKSEQIMAPEDAKASLEKYEAEQKKTLTDGQKAAAEHIVTSKDQVVGIQGDAGTGKTTMLDAVRDMAEKEGYEVKGLAPTGKAAEEMEAAAKINSQTIDSFLNDKNNTFNQERIDQINKNYQEQMEKAAGIESAKARDKYEQAVAENTAIAREKLQDKDSAPALDENKKQLWIIDEASMVDSKKMNEIFNRAREAQEAGVEVKIVVMGDDKQLQAIGAGKAYQDLKESGAIEVVRMNENIRQKDSPEYQQAMRDMADKKIDKALDRLEASAKIHEIKDHDERIKAIVDDYTSRKDYKNTIIVTDRNDDRREMNEQIREKLKAEGKLNGPEYTFTVKENKGLSPEAKHYAQSYEVGDIVTAKSGMGKPGNEARVITKDEQNHTITTRDKDNHTYVMDLKKDGNKLDAYKEREASFCQGDKVVCGKNDKGRKLKNGHTAEIKKIDADGNMSLKMENGKVKDVNVKDYAYVSEGYAVSVHKSQGQTAPTKEGRVIYHGDTTKGVNQNGAYVGMSRGKKSVDVYTDNKQEFREQVKVPQEKKSTIDHSKTTEQQPVKSHDGHDRDGKDGWKPEPVSDKSQQSKAHGQDTSKSHDTGTGKTVESGNGKVQYSGNGRSKTSEMDNPAPSKPQGQVSTGTGKSAETETVKGHDSKPSKVQDQDSSRTGEAEQAKGQNPSFGKTQNQETGKTKNPEMDNPAPDKSQDRGGMER